MFHSHALKNAFKEAFAIAGTKAEKLDVFQPHDCSIYVCWSYLDTLGHPEIPYGYGPKFISKGEGYPNGKLPILTCATTKSGQPRGAVALDFVIENYLQLSEKAGERQVKVRNGWAASGTSPERPTIIILRREK